MNLRLATVLRPTAACAQIALLLFVSLQAHALTETSPSTAPGTRMDRVIAKIDSNGDQALSVSELLAVRKQRFDRLDSNNDQRLSADELAVVMKAQRVTKMLEKLDGDKNLSLSLAEWEAVVAEKFARLDVNQDNFLSRDEIPKRRKFR